MNQSSVWQQAPPEVRVIFVVGLFVVFAFLPLGVMGNFVGLSDRQGDRALLRAAVDIDVAESHQLLLQARCLKCKVEGMAVCLGGFE